MILVIPIGLIKGIVDAINKIMDRIDAEEMKRLYHSTGIKGRIEVEKAEILFIVREVKE